MNERTKTILNWAIALGISGAVLLLILFPEAFGAISPTAQKAGYMLADPSMILLEFVTRNAIDQFGGNMGMEGFSSSLIFGLTGVAIIFVIAPTLILIGYKKSGDINSRLRPAIWHVGTGIVLVAVGYGVYSSINWSASKKNIIESTERQHAMDQLQFELIDLYYNASAEVILPHEKGGGKGQFTNFIADDSSTRDIQLRDLNRFNTDSQFDFVISEVSDSTITITGVSDYEGNDPDFQNADGSTGHIQLSVIVNPYEDSRLNIRRENDLVFASRES
jgi:hypothetical protein